MANMHSCSKSPLPGDLPSYLVPDGYRTVHIPGDVEPVRVPKMSEVVPRWFAALADGKVCGHEGQASDPACAHCPKRG